MNTPPHIAVIGAGLAGLSCATLLQRAGFAVSVFDKSRAAGGRMSTRRGDGWQCDHGAQYFTARDPDFCAEVARWCAAGAAALWQPRLQILGEAALRAVDPTVQRFVGTPRMTAPARLLAAELPITTSITIQQLQQQPRGWQLVSIEHGIVRDDFAAVLLAVPAPQAVPLLQLAAPQLANLASTVRMRGSWALMLQFAAPLALPFDAAFVNTGPLGWIARDRSKPGRVGQESWLLHANAAWSEQHLDSSSDDVAAALLAAFAELAGPIPQVMSQTTPQTWSAHRWRYADTEQPLMEGCVWSAADNIGLCGDWLNGGKVEGAWLSGRALAQQVIKSFATL
jgi:predicted NAD/FAD-dependent oxidoreductase